MEKIRIYLIEDNVLFREGIMAITKNCDDIEIIKHQIIILKGQTESDLRTQSYGPLVGCQVA